MEQAGLQINIGANVLQATQDIGRVTDNLAELATEGVGNIASVNLALAELRDAQIAASDPAKLKVLNNAIKDLSSEAQRLKNVGTAGFDDLGNKIRAIGPATQDASRGFENLLGSTAKNRVAFVDLGRIITGEGFSLRSVATNFTLFNPLVVVAAAAIGFLAEQFLKQSDAEKKAAEDAKKLKEYLVDLKSAGDITISATGSEAGNIARVEALAAAVADTNKSYKERNNALLELRETNKNYFGDLTLEAASLKTLSDRVADYSKALITEAIVKGQVDEIAKVSSELEKQKQVLDELKDSRNRANTAFEDAKKIPQISGGTGGVTSLTSEVEAETAEKTKSAFEAQQVVVDKLSTSVAAYTGELQKNIAEQIKQKPLQSDSKGVDTLQKEIESLEKAKSALDALTKGSRPTFAIQQQLDEVNTKLLQDRITIALRDGVKNGLSPAVVALQVSALQQELAKIGSIKKVSIIGIAEQKGDVPGSDGLDEKLEKSFGDKPVKVTVPIDVKLNIEDSSYNKGEKEILLRKAEEDALKNMPVIRWTPKIQAIIDNKTLSTELGKQLTATLNKSFLSVTESGFENLGQSIGKAIAAGQNPIQAAGKAILESLGQLIEDIGKSMIEYGITKTFLDNILSAGIELPGVAAIALGVAAEAIGALVKGAGSSYKAFATGGIITGPTLGLIGEAGPEVVFPLDRLNRFVKSNSQGAGAQTVRVVGQISGRNINLASVRDNKNQALV